MHDVEDKVSRNRKRPRETPNNKKNVRLVWKEASRAEIEAPMVIDDYIHWMLGVDLADQLIAHYCMKLRCRRTWMPLFMQLINIARTNSYVAQKNVKKQRGEKHQGHEEFILDFIVAMVERNKPAGPAPKKKKR